MRPQATDFWTLLIGTLLAIGITMLIGALIVRFW
jgi:hypothetical protein